MTDGKEQQSILDLLISEKLRSSGYEVNTEVSLDLRNIDVRYQADIVAKRGQFTVVVECKTLPIRIPLDRYFIIAKALSEYSKTKFVIVDKNLSNNMIEELSLSFEERKSKVINKIDRTNKSIDRIIASEDPSTNTAILLMYSSNISSLLSLMSEKLSIPTYLLPKEVNVKALYSQGEIDHELYQSVLIFDQLRKEIADSDESRVPQELFEMAKVIQREIRLEIEENDEN